MPGTTPISAIQGRGLSSGMINSTVVVEGIVVGDFQGSQQLRGFFVQEEDGDRDALPETSEGLFVFFSGADVARGDRVRVQGVVTEFSQLTELTNVTKVEFCDAGNSVTPTVVPLPVTSLNRWEQYEGMLVTF